MPMAFETAVRISAGVMILGSLAIAHLVSIYLLFLTAFVGFNSVQSGFTNWRPAMSVFRSIGLRDGNSKCALDGQRVEALPA
jgi:hypothetical protein